MKTVKTAKGTELPLTNLKGKDYLMVAYRLQWLTEETPNYVIDTQVETKDAESVTVKAVVTILKEDGRVAKSASARKSESKRDFPDFLEKAETGAVGRALAMLGFGTQHAVADLDEGTRIVDSPLVNVKSEKASTEATAATAAPVSKRTPGSFARNKKADTATPAVANGSAANGKAETAAVNDGWE